MLKFIRYENGMVRNETLKKRSTQKEMRKFYEDGIRFSYTDGATGQDLLPHFLDWIDDGAIQIEIKPSKLRACRDCGGETVNYFRCKECWYLEQRRIVVL
jgi:hypothetical protein